MWQARNSLRRRGSLEAAGTGDVGGAVNGAGFTASEWVTRCTSGKCTDRHRAGVQYDVTA